MQEKINELSIKAYLGAKMCVSNVKEGVLEFFNDENGISGIVVAVILVLVAVLLLVVFQKNITELLEKMWSNIGTQSESFTGSGE